MPVEVETIRSVEVPTRLVHGPGAVRRLAEALGELGVTRPLLVTDPGVVAAGLVQRALDGLVVLRALASPRSAVRQTAKRHVLAHADREDGVLALRHDRHASRDLVAGQRTRVGYVYVNRAA